MLEDDPSALAQHERPRARRIVHLRLLVQQPVDVFEVGHRLAELAVDDAEEVERTVELQQEGVDQHHIAHRAAAVQHAVGGEQHEHRHADADDGGLAGIEHGQRDLRAHRGILVGREAAIQPRHLEPLVAEGLDHLVVDQPVHGGGGELVLAPVHLAAELRAPLGHREGEAGVGGDGEEDRERPGGRIVPQQHRQHEGEFQQGGDQPEEHRAEQEGDGLDAAVHRPGQLAGALVEMEAQRQAEEMLVDLAREGAPGPLGDAGEDGIAQLVEAGGEQPGERIGHHQRHGETRHRCRRRQLVHRALEPEGDGDGDQLGGEQGRERRHHPQPQGGIGRPQARCEQPRDARGRWRRGAGGVGTRVHGRNMGVAQRAASRRPAAAPAYRNASSGGRKLAFILS
ncbi:hypothetical protein HRbin39_01759 [bacterium HR39]|nr:hypothetical protein HRbin39_01759 [bacterium HR39]